MNISLLSPYLYPYTLIWLCYVIQSCMSDVRKTYIGIANTGIYVLKYILTKNKHKAAWSGVLVNSERTS